MNVVYYKIIKFTKRNATKAHTLLLLLLEKKKYYLSPTLDKCVPTNTFVHAWVASRLVGSSSYKALGLGRHGHMRKGTMNAGD